MQGDANQGEVCEDLNGEPEVEVKQTVNELPKAFISNHKSLSNVF